MIDIGSSTGHKIGILLILTTLTIGSVAAISWENPSDGDDFKDTITLNVSAPSSSSINFYYDDGSVNQISSEDTPSSGDYYTNDWDSSNAGTGTFDLIAGNTTVNETVSVTADFAKPSVDSFSPSSGGYTNEESDLDVSYSSSDSDSSVDFQNISISSESESENDSDLTGLSLDDGSYTVDYWVNDTVGNVNSGSWDFTVDTSYDAGTNPDFEYDDGHIFELEDEDDDQTVEVTVDGEDDENADVRLTCYDGSDDQIDQTDYEDLGNSDESHTFECDLSADEDDYGGKSVDMYVELEDEAGNVETLDDSDETMTYYMDLDAPSVSGLEISTNADLYNSNFDVEFLASDDASGVEEIEYYFEEGVSEDERTSFDSVDQDSYEIDTSELSEGDHTLYVRAKDEADRWSSAETIDFSFDPDAVPEISLDIPENVSVTAGDQGSFDVTVENTGDIFISSIELNGSAEGVFSDSQSISDLEPDQSVTATLDIDTESNNLGEHTIEVSTDNPSMTKELDLIVEANAEQQEEIDSNLSEYQNRLQDMEANVSTLMQKVSEDNKQKLDSNFSSFKQKVEDAQTAVENGDYYEAEEALEGIDQDYSAAESTYETVNKEYKNSQFWMLVFLSLGGIIVVGGGIIGVLSYTDEVDFDIRDYLEDLQELEFEDSFVEKYADKLKRLLEGKDTSDAEDFQWDGFDNK